jgi:hypothetical protein
MRPETWFGRIWARLKSEVIQDVPPSLAECESCREADCTQARWLTCARRLAAEAEQSYASEDYVPSVTGRTDEMPGLFETDNPQEKSDENDPAECGCQRKRISSSGD